MIEKISTSSKKYLKNLVHEILLDDSEARESDFYLIACVYQKIYPAEVSHYDLFSLFYYSKYEVNCNIKLYSFESITRARRLIQAKDPECMSSDQKDKIRFKNLQVMEEFIKEEENK